MGTGPICLRAIFLLASEISWKIMNLNSTIEYTSIHRSEKTIAHFLLEKIANVNKPLGMLNFKNFKTPNLHPYFT